MGTSLVMYCNYLESIWCITYILLRVGSEPLGRLWPHLVVTAFVSVESFFLHVFFLSLAYLPCNGSVSVACAFVLLGHSRPLFCAVGGRHRCAVPRTLLHACCVFVWAVTKAFACACCRVLRVLALQPTSSLLWSYLLRTPSPVFVSLLCSWLIVLSSFVLVIVLTYRLPRTAAAAQPPPTPGHLWPVTTEVGLLASPTALKLASMAQAASPEEARWTRHVASSILMKAVGLLTSPAALKLASMAQAASPRRRGGRGMRPARSCDPVLGACSVPSHLYTRAPSLA
jgi:hypothetical protein